jgi:hypothetical protein
VAQCPLDAKAILAWGNMHRKQTRIVVIGSLGMASGRRPLDPSEWCYYPPSLHRRAYLGILLAGGRSTRSYSTRCQGPERRGPFVDVEQMKA